MVAYYSPFWTVVQAFQSLIAASVGLIAAGSAIYGIKLKSWLDESAEKRKRRRARVVTATMICSLLATEERFPEVSVLRCPSQSEVCEMLRAGSSIDLKPNDYVAYLSSMVSSLSDYPAPICDRANFLSWVAGRVALATAQSKRSGLNDQEALARAASDVRLLLIAAIEVVGDLGLELSNYKRAPELYEEQWLKSPDAKNWVAGMGTIVRSRAFNLQDLKEAVALTAQSTSNK